jgi:hypothetical protein
MRCRSGYYIASLLWRTFPTADAVRTFFGSALPNELSEVIGRVARLESALARLTSPVPIEWANRPLLKCAGRGGGGVDLFLRGMEMMATTHDVLMSNLDALTCARPHLMETWLLEYWIPPSGIAVTRPAEHSAGSESG